MLKNKKTVFYSLILLSSAFNSQTTLAGTMADKSLLSSWFISLSGGPVWENSNEMKTLILQPQVVNSYVPDQTDVLASGEIFLGIQRELKPQLHGQLGLAVAGLSTATLTGHVWQGANPKFNNFTYSWRAQDTRVSVKGKLLKDTTFYNLSPYATVSLGVGFNKASKYRTVPLTFKALPEPDFRSNTTTAFTYAVGMGVQRALNDHFQAGVGYEFVDWGRNALATAPGQTIKNVLSIDHFYTNGLMFTLTYLA